MSLTAPPVPIQDLLKRDAGSTEVGTRGFEERWAAWQARGAAHDQTARRRFMMVAPVFAVVAAVVYVLLLR
jgi:hypothetical protein